MALQTSGAISISQIKTELGSSSNSLRTLSAAAGKSTPDSMSEFYGYSAYTPPSLGTWGTSQSGAGTQSNPYIITRNSWGTTYDEPTEMAYDCGTVPGLEPYEFWNLYDVTEKYGAAFTNQTNVAQKMHVTMSTYTSGSYWDGWCNNIYTYMYFLNGPTVAAGQSIPQGTYLLSASGNGMYTALKNQLQNLVWDLNTVTVGHQYFLYLNANKWTYQIGVACGDGPYGYRYFDDPICGSFYTPGISSVTWSIWFEPA